MIALFENKGWCYLKASWKLVFRSALKEQQLIIYILFVSFVYFDVNIYPSDPLNPCSKIFLLFLWFLRDKIIREIDTSYRFHSRSAMLKRVWHYSHLFVRFVWFVFDKRKILQFSNSWYLIREIRAIRVRNEKSIRVCTIWKAIGKGGGPQGFPFPALQKADATGEGATGAAAT